MSTRKSLIFSFLDRYASLAINIASSMVIARLLTPAEIGVFSVTMVLLMFVTTVRDMGAGQYMVQEKDLTTDRIRAVWAVQLGLGLGLAGIVLLSSYPVALFYNEPRMRDIMLVVALNYAINPFGSLTYAWLMREMRFDSIAFMRFSGTLTGALVSIWLAWQGHGPISLAWGAVSSTLVNALMAVHFRPKNFPWKPGLRELRRVLSFGSQLTGTSFINVLAGNAPELLLGKLQDITAVGLYSRAMGLVSMVSRLFVEAVSAVCLPWFASQIRERGEFSTSFVKATAYITVLGWSFCLAVVCLAQPMIRLLYGNQWDDAVDLTRLLAVAIAFGLPSTLCKTALLSMGAVNMITRTTVIASIQTVVFVVVGASQGLLATGYAAIAFSAVNSVLWLRATIQQVPFTWSDLFQAFRKCSAVALLSAIGPGLAAWIYGPYPNVIGAPLLLGGVVGLVGFLMGIIFIEHPLKEEALLIWLKVKKRVI